MNFRLHQLTTGEVPLKQIVSDTWTEASLDPVPPALAESIDRIGMTQPVILVPCATGYRIVCGHRRVEAAHDLGWPTVPARMLDEEIGDADQLRLNLWDNRAHRRYSDVETGLLVYKLTAAGVPEDTIITQDLPLLGLEASRKLAHDYARTAELGPSLYHLLHELNIPLRVYALLFQWDGPGHHAIERLLAVLRPGVNKLRDLLEWIDEIAVRDGVTPFEVLNRADIQTPLNAPDTPAPEKYDRIRRTLRRWRYPHLSELQERVLKAVDQLKLDDRTRLRFPENFEHDQLKIELRFTTKEELQGQVERLFGALDSAGLDALLSLFREMR